MALAAIRGPELFALGSGNKFGWAFLEIAKLALAIVVVPFESRVVIAIELLGVSVRSNGSVIAFAEAVVNVPGVGELAVLVEEQAFCVIEAPVLAWCAGFGNR